jgi:probable rRNA maturation factor
MKVEVAGTSRTDVDEATIEEFVAAILHQESVDDESVLSVQFIDTNAIADLNSRHMLKRGPTDVLSFPIEDAAPGRPPLRDLDGPPLELGDIFICEDIVASHAEEYGVSFNAELHLMVVHGVLHILGWDHQTDAEAEAMEEREAEYLATIGLERR